MSIKDLKQMLEKHNDVFADMVNGVVFEGRQKVLANELEELSLHSPYGDGWVLDGLYRTVIKRTKDCIIRLVCIDHDSKAVSDPEFPMQMRTSEAEVYGAQLLDQSKTKYPVVTLVLYFGYDKPWSGPLSLKEWYERFGQECYEIFGPLKNDYVVNFFQIANLTHEQLAFFKSDFRVVADFFVQMREKGNYNGNPQPLKYVQETLQMLSVMANDKTFAQEALEIAKNPKGAPNNMDEIMCNIKKRVREKK